MYGIGNTVGKELQTLYCLKRPMRIAVFDLRVYCSRLRSSFVVEKRKFLEMCAHAVVVVVEK